MYLFFTFRFTMVIKLFFLVLFVGKSLTAPVNELTNNQISVGKSSKSFTIGTDQSKAWNVVVYQYVKDGQANAQTKHVNKNGVINVKINSDGINNECCGNLTF